MGGDALLMSNDKLEYILKKLRDIPHVEIIRIGTRTPVVMPQRITDDLVNMIKKAGSIEDPLCMEGVEMLRKSSVKACGVARNEPWVRGCLAHLIQACGGETPRS